MATHRQSSLFPIILLPAALIVLLGFTTISRAQNPGFTLHFDAVDAVLTGSTFSVRALLDNPAGDLAGWSVVICHDANIDIVSAEAGSAPATANGGSPADFSQTFFFPGEGVRQGVIVSFPGLNELPISSDHELVLIEYIALGASGTDTTIEFCSFIFSGDNAYSTTIVIETTGIAIIPTMVPAQIFFSDGLFLRGEINGDISVNIADALFLLTQLFSGGPAGTCADASDVNDDGSVNLADPIRLLAYLFSGGEVPDAPFPACGVDPTADMLGCVSFGACP
ncbi:MAG: hypothetical protein DSY92_04470 [Planctomycetota bacterium]|nr:MAG: hypothetical protein DSY92_04470 [Planctomycetota bacterium]